VKILAPKPSPAPGQKAGGGGGGCRSAPWRWGDAAILPTLPAIGARWDGGAMQAVLEVGQSPKNDLQASCKNAV
jgi:hypothetical protein